jgi:hypothetical protein
MSDFRDTFAIYHYAQYFLLFIYVFWLSRKWRYKYSVKELHLFLILFLLGLISFFVGMVVGYEANLKPLVATFLFCCAVASSRVFPAKKILKFLVLFLIIEMFLGYVVFPDFHLRRSLGPIVFLRPVGPVLDMHLTALLVVFLCYAVVRKKAITFAMVIPTVNLQAIITSIFLVMFSQLKSKNLLWLIFYVMTLPVVIYFLLLEIGYLGESAVFNVLTLFDELRKSGAFDVLDWRCVLFGCSVDITSVDEISEISLHGLNVFSDFGYLRVLYQFGFLWLVVITYILVRISWLGSLAFFVSAFHYPVVFGILALPIFVHIIKGSSFSDRRLV